MSSLALCNQDSNGGVTFDAASSAFFFTLRTRCLQRVDDIGFISFDLVFRGLQTTPTLRNAVESTWTSGKHVISWH